MNAQNFKTKYFSGSNVAEVTDDLLNDLLAVTEEATIEEDITALHKVCSKDQPVFKVNGLVTPAYSAWVAEQVAAKKAFEAKYGRDALTIFVMNKTLKTRIANITRGKNRIGSFGRLQNSKGYGYGNL